MAAPAIHQLGVPMLAAHRFIMYFGVFADITPPVALVTYATAGIAKADATKSSLIAVRLAAAGFIVPFVFIYSPGLLLADTWTNTLIATGTTIVGICALAFAASGYWLRHLHVAERALVFGAAVTLIFPGLITDLTGAALLIIVYITQKTWPGHGTGAKPA
jgi:TRAP-type uncharacterized transport system fused permease subunit